MSTKSTGKVPTSKRRSEKVKHLIYDPAYISIVQDFRATALIMRKESIVQDRHVVTD